MRRTLLSTITWLAAVAALAAILAWATGRITSDRWYWSQFFSWLPTPIILAGAGGSLAVAWTVSRLSRPSPARRTIILVSTLWAAALLYMLIGEWRLLSPKPDQAPALRVLFFNAETAPAVHLPEQIVEQRPQLLLISNAPFNTDWVKIRSTMGDTTYTVRWGRFSIVSTLPISRWGGEDLGITGAIARTFVWSTGSNISVDRGQALFVQLDATAQLGRPITTWIIDLPSDPDIPRTRMLTETAAAIHAFKGPVFNRDQAGMDTASREPAEGFPQPDLIVGDFNTPRGSASLQLLAGGMHHAFRQAGRGFAATFPREFPLLPIDQAFLSPKLTATDYRIIDMGTGKHCAEVFAIAGAP